MGELANPEFEQLVKDCLDIVDKAKVRITQVARKELLKLKYDLGERILQSKCPLVDNQKLAERLSIDRRRVWELIEFAKYVDEGYQSFENYLTKSPELESWNTIKYWYLPQLKCPYEEEEEPKALDEQKELTVQPKMIKCPHCGQLINLENNSQGGE